MCLRPKCPKTRPAPWLSLPTPRTRLRRRRGRRGGSGVSSRNQPRPGSVREPRTRGEPGAAPAPPPACPGPARRYRSSRGAEGRGETARRRAPPSGYSPRCPQPRIAAFRNSGCGISPTSPSPTRKSGGGLNYPGAEQPGVAHAPGALAAAPPQAQGPRPVPAPPSPPSAARQAAPPLLRGDVTSRCPDVTGRRQLSRTERSRSRAARGVGPVVCRARSQKTPLMTNALPVASATPEAEAGAALEPGSSALYALCPLRGDTEFRIGVVTSREQEPPGSPRRGEPSRAKLLCCSVVGSRL